MSGLGMLLMAVFFPMACLAEMESDRVVARVGETSITAAQLRAEMQRRGGGRPGQYAEVEDRKALLDEMIEKELRVQGAKAQGLMDDPRVVAALDLMLSRLIEEEWMKSRAERLEISEEEIASEWEERKEEFRLPERRQIALIRLDLPFRGDGEAIRAKAQSARKEALGLSADDLHFGDLASSYSDDRATRFQGGSVGWLAKRSDYRWPAEVVEAAFSLSEPGAISEIIEADGSLWLVRLGEIAPSTFRSLESVRSVIEHDLQRRRHRELRAELHEDLAADLDLWVDESAVELLEVPESRPPSLPGG